MSIHILEKGYSNVNFVKKIFSVKGYLTGHECTYTGNKPCQCKFCKKGFSQNGNINEHGCTHTQRELIQI